MISFTAAHQTRGLDNYAVLRYATADYSTQFRYSQAGYTTEMLGIFWRASLAATGVCLTNRVANQRNVRLVAQLAVFPYRQYCIVPPKSKRIADCQIYFLLARFIWDVV